MSEIRVPEDRKCVHCGREIFPPSNELPFWRDSDNYAPGYCLENSAGHEPSEIAILQERIARVEAERDEFRALYNEIVKRLEASFIVAGLGEWTEWDAAIKAFVKAVQAQEHLAKLATDRYEQLLAKDRDQTEVAILQEQTKVLREALVEFVGAAQSWHDFHEHTEGIQCDRLCACIAPARAALNSGERGKG